MKGILADINVIGQVAYLVQLMQAEPWRDFWKELGLVLRRFEEVGLAPNATDVEIWQRCQADELILITDNRNDDSPDSLAAAIRKCSGRNAMKTRSPTRASGLAGSRKRRPEVPSIRTAPTMEM